METPDMCVLIDARIYG